MRTWVTISRYICQDTVKQTEPEWSDVRQWKRNQRTTINFRSYWSNAPTRANTDGSAENRYRVTNSEASTYMQQPMYVIRDEISRCKPYQIQ